ncbi:MAG: alanine racemase [Lachnospiraceae bacterium]|nr:alanine racemase [Lachnospiraceae bacterium]
MQIPKNVILEQAKCHTSFYLYQEAVIREETNRLKSHFPNVTFLYSMKTNSHPHVVRTIFDQGFGVDAASLAEAKAGQAYGMPARMIQYSAPGKSVSEIETALDFATLIADSVGEVTRIQEAAARQGIIAQIGIRINPNFTFYSETGVPAKFGIDEEQVFALLPQWNALPNIKIVGIHVHSRSQELNTDVICRYYEKMFDLASRIQSALGHPLQFVNLGSGIGIPFAPEDAPVDTARLGQHLSAQITAFADRLPHAQIYIETGRYASGKSGLYVTTVVDKKISRGKTFVMLAQTLNGFIRPSIIPFVQSFTKEACPAANEPLFTKPGAFSFLPLRQKETDTTQIITLVGSLCTAQDIVAADIELPAMEVGDLMVMTNAGSYAASITPFQFSSHIPPAQLFLTTDGEVLNA